jgi:hypothetical protein
MLQKAIFLVPGLCLRPQTTQDSPLNEFRLLDTDNHAAISIKTHVRVFISSVSRLQVLQLIFNNLFFKYFQFLYINSDLDLFTRSILLKFLT